MVTVGEILKKIERLKKELDYVRGIQEKWRDQRDRFPKIYEGIVEQERAFLRRIEQLQGLKVDSMAPFDAAEEAAAAAAAASQTPSPAAAFAAADDPLGRPKGDGAEPGTGSIAVAAPSSRGDSNDERRAAGPELGGEKIRKRTAASSLGAESAAPEASGKV
jgi:hypothetical protein